MLRIFQRLWQVNWAEQWQYRANLIMYLLYWLVSPIIYLAVWTSIANSKGSVNGFTANDFVTYYMTLLVVDQITSNITIHLLAYKIQDGTLASELIRPIHPVLTNTLVNNIAFKTLTIMGLVPIWIILFFAFRPDYGHVAWQGIALSLPAMLLGFTIGFLLSEQASLVVGATLFVDGGTDAIMHPMRPEGMNVPAIAMSVAQKVAGVATKVQAMRKR